jgi:hypothetical protein
LGFNPFGRIGLDRSDEIGNGYRPRKRTNNMYVIVRPADFMRRTSASAAGRCQISIERILNLGFKIGRAVFRAKNNMNQYICQRLGHKKILV